VDPGFGKPSVKTDRNLEERQGAAAPPWPPIIYIYYRFSACKQPRPPFMSAGQIAAPGQQGSTFFHLTVPAPSRAPREISLVDNFLFQSAFLLDISLRRDVF
jgi:hypothetical protein